MQTFGIYEKPPAHAEDALMAGETDVVQWPLDLMRRQQLHDLARAYELPLGDEDTKQSIMPSMRAAQKSGLFKQPPKNPKLARKAMQHPDQAKDAGRSNSFAA